MESNKPTTKEVFDMYFASCGMNESSAKKLRPQVDRPEVYDFEAKLGKQVFEMDVDELYAMIETFGDNRRSKGGSTHFGISYASYDQIASLFRQIFNWYADNVRLIRNPWNDKRMRGAAAVKRLALNKEVFTMKTMNDIIQKVRDAYDDDRADYIELTMLLFYCGFEVAGQISNMKESDINFKRHTVMVRGRNIQLSDRCFGLLVKIHNMEFLEGWRGEYKMVPWHGSYYKFSVRPKEVDDFDARTIEEVNCKISQLIVNMVNKKLDVKVNYRTLYLFGFYNFMCDRVGKKRVKEILTSQRVDADVRDFLDLANYYGIDVSSPYHTKKALCQFVEGINDEE